MTQLDDLQSLIGGRKLMAHLATSVDDRPHVAPVWYAYDDGTVLVLTSGRKLQNIRQNPRVALSFQDDEDGDSKWMAAIRGTATVVEDPARINEAVMRVYAKYEGDDVDTWEEAYRQDLTDDPRNTLVEISVGSASVHRYE